MKELDEWEEAGEAYFEAAQAVDFNEIPQISAIKAFKLSIQCFLRIKSRKAYLSFVKVIDCYLQDNQILKAIQHWVEYGYLIRNVFRDRFKSVEFYQQADLLRIDHDIPHRCAITTFDINKYNILEKALDDFQKFFVNEQNGSYAEKEVKSVCGRCIDAFVKLNQYITEMTSLKRIKICQIYNIYKRFD
ncbi:hypothetical protein RF11_08034 [Thelohanellus kitauei]|uniref:Alpha-soluble NSF attachment protein n=1 Tax=Thelohanellus kitauei TaxID=669202 RepID=A0A0C2J821_THEKT|nr:hypothetical protein RF11_08034 [Thelohanellus kitauei]